MIQFACYEISGNLNVKPTRLHMQVKSADLQRAVYGFDFIFMA